MFFSVFSVFKRVAKPYFFAENKREFAFMSRKKWLTIQVSSMVLFLSLVLSLAHYANTYPTATRDLFYGNYVAAAIGFLIIIILVYIAIIAEVKKRNGQINLKGSLLIIGFICLIIILAVLNA